MTSGVVASFGIIAGLLVTQWLVRVLRPWRWVRGWLRG